MLEPGEQIDRYVVERVLGSGGMATVYAARHAALHDRRVAIKLLHPHLGRQPGLVERFVSEARLQSRLQCPHILQVRDILTWRGLPVLVMDFVEGGSLADALDDGDGFPLGEVLDLADQLLLGLATAHEAGVVHRDLKPDNILLSTDASGRRIAVISDFGIAKIADSVAGTQTGALMGTLAYMSPEQIEDSSKVDARSDVYSLGIVLWEMLAGQHPFQRHLRSNPELVLLVSRGELGRLPVQVPAAVAEWVGRMTAPLARRFASAADARAALHALRTMLPSTANLLRPPAPPRVPVPGPSLGRAETEDAVSTDPTRLAAPSQASDASTRMAPQPPVDPERAERGPVPLTPSAYLGLEGSRVETPAPHPGPQTVIPREGVPVAASAFEGHASPPVEPARAQPPDAGSPGHLSSPGLSSVGHASGRVLSQEALPAHVESGIAASEPVAVHASSGQSPAPSPVVSRPTARFVPDLRSAPTPVPLAGAAADTAPGAAGTTPGAVAGGLPAPSTPRRTEPLGSTPPRPSPAATSSRGMGAGMMVLLLALVVGGGALLAVAGRAALARWGAAAGSSEDAVSLVDEDTTTPADETSAGAEGTPTEREAVAAAEPGEDVGTEATATPAADAGASAVDSSTATPERHDGLPRLGRGRAAPGVPAWAPESPCPAGFVLVPAGLFIQGSPPGETGRVLDEAQQRVRLSRPFCMGSREVTQGEWIALQGTNPSRFVTCGLECPVENVSYADALGYLASLNAAAGFGACHDTRGVLVGGETPYDCEGFRLPTEAEWEYAARAGATAATWMGPLDVRGANHAPTLNAIAVFAGTSDVRYENAVACSAWPERGRPGRFCGTRPVASTSPNAWGLFDVLGNVWEWTSDPHAKPVGQGGPVVTDPFGDAGPAERVIRGGAWDSPARDVRLARRRGLGAVERSPSVGLRVVIAARP